MRVLIGCEFTGAVRREFRKLGHDAWSNDLLAAADEDSHHLQMDVFDAIEHYGPWDLGIFHPDCTYLTSAAEWCYSEEAAEKAASRGSDALFGAARQAAREEALRFFSKLWNCSIPRVVIENPVGVVPRRLGLKPTQIVQPYEYGHDARKATCLWIRGGLKTLSPTERVSPKHGCPCCRRKMVFDPQDDKCPVCGKKMKTVWGNQTPSGQNNLGPSEDRWALRAATYEGIARAMAITWGDS